MCPHVSTRFPLHKQRHTAHGSSGSDGISGKPLLQTIREQKAMSMSPKIAMLS
jgi:hypothetical protein